VSVVFLYTEQHQPPAPFLLVNVLKPGEAAEGIADQPAQVDSAADRTILPMSLIERLQLTPSGKSTFSGLGGHEVTLELYRVEIIVSRLRPREIEVAAHPEEPLILLGRDFLNQFRIFLDGPGNRLQIADP
jgi:hypothetical protein